MITNNEFASRIINNLKANTKDGHISKRFVLNVGMTKARFLLSQKLDERTLFREEGIISHITCFRMKEVSVKNCGIFEFRHCDNLMISCEKLPEGLFGKNGAGIITVMSVDGYKVYDYISPRQYANLKNRQRYVSKDKGFYYIKDGYLYLPNSTNELVEISMFALKKWEVEKSCNCDQNKEQDCRSFLDLEFVCPDRFLDLVQRDTLQELASVYRTSIADENPNQDENIKSRA